ncbi:TIM-barrel domain-containing protein [Sunxiuqinia rutila]|uniref:glycoside hydrolase family 31 protein n=1 Tax=Sunxiuqinia rutila TaxID=1397841 RepID=UPI003D36B5ED
MKTLNITLSLFLMLVVLGCKNNKLPQKFVHSPTEVADTNVVLPPAWAFGIVYGAYTNQEQSIELVNQIIEHDYPIDAFWIDSWIWDWENQGQGPKKYMDFVGDTVSYPDLKAMCDFMEEKDIKAGMWMWDAIMKTGNEAEYEDFKSRGFFKSEKIRTDGWHNGLRTTIIGDSSKEVKGTWCGDIDFENPEATAYFQEKVKHFFDQGMDFIKLDKTDAIPVCKAMFETTQKLGKETAGRGFILSHSHGVEREEYKKYPGKWTDDTRADWNVENPNHDFSPWLPRVAFKENLAMYTDTSRHFHKIPFLANDMGGFAIPTDGTIDEELYIRWLEFALFAPITTPFSQPENPTQNIAFKVSKRADKIFRELAHLKMELFPYIYSYAHKVRLDGVGVMRPTRMYEYKLGEEIFVAPVYEQGATTRKLTLPEGASWIGYWDGKHYQEGELEIDAPLGQIPVFIKEGAIIPKREYARSVEAGTNDLLELHIYDGADGEFTLIEDDGISNDYLKGVFAKTGIQYQVGDVESILTIGAVEGFYNEMAKMRSWKLVLHTQKELKNILVDGKNLEFSSNDGVVTTAVFEAQRTQLQKVTFNF